MDVRLRLQVSQKRIPPVHAALCRSDAIDRDVLLHETTATPRRNSFLFPVEGAPKDEARWSHRSIESGDTHREAAFDPGPPARPFEALEAGAEVDSYASSCEGSAEVVGGRLDVASHTAVNTSGRQNVGWCTTDSTHRAATHRNQSVDADIVMPLVIIA